MVCDKSTYSSVYMFLLFCLSSITINLYRIIVTIKHISHKTMKRKRNNYLNKTVILLFVAFTCLSLLFSISIAHQSYQYKIRSMNISKLNERTHPENMPLMHINTEFITRWNRSSLPRCIVAVRTRRGRFGNRLFIIASAYALARQYSCSLFISVFMLEELRSVFIFNIRSALMSTVVFNLIRLDKTKPMKKLSQDIGCRYVTETQAFNMTLNGSIFELHGYWQSYYNFDLYQDELKNEIFVGGRDVIERVSKLFHHIYEKFQMKHQFSIDNHHLLKKQLRQSNLTTWIGIHVRRKDFIPLNYSSSSKYLFAAIDFYTSRFPNAHFIVVSDDKYYCKRLFRHRSNIFITPRSFSEGDDFTTLTLCEHSIITGGTFGWWASYLAGGQVIYDTAYVPGCKNKDLYYPPWFTTLDEASAYDGTL